GMAQHPGEHRVQGDDGEREHEHDPEQPTELRDVVAVVVVARMSVMTRMAGATGVVVPSVAAVGTAVGMLMHSMPLLADGWLVAHDRPLLPRSSCSSTSMLYPLGVFFK